MAVSQKASRRIVVDGVVYLWRFPRRPTEMQEDGRPGVWVTLNREDFRNSTLFLYFPERFHLSGCVAHVVPPRPVLPADVARGVRAALAAGWRAEEPAPMFRHCLRENL